MKPSIMHTTSIKSGMIWKLVERFSAAVVSLSINAVLSRLLSAEDYGVLSLITIFVLFADIFVTSGIGVALIQKKNVNEDEFTTMFFVNCLFSMALYGIVFFSAPWIANFYGYSSICSALRVLGLQIIISSANTIQKAYISRQMMFREFFFATLSGKIISGVIGIVMAFIGFGIWSLVMQTLFMTVSETVVLWLRVKWRPHGKVDIGKIKPLLSFAWKNIFYKAFESLAIHTRSLLIGKFYNATELGYYTKGDLLPNTLATNIVSSITAVLLPSLSSIQDEKEKVRIMVATTQQFLCFILFPILMGMALTSPSVIKIIFGEKWLNSAIYTQILCLSYAFSSLEVVPDVALRSIGQINITMRLKNLRNILLLVTTFLGLRHSIHYVIISLTFVNFLSSLLFLIHGNFYLHYSLTMFIKDNYRTMLITLIMGLAVYMINFWKTTAMLVFTTQLIAGILIYVALSLLTNKKLASKLITVLKK